MRKPLSIIGCILLPGLLSAQTPQEFLQDIYMDSAALSQQHIRSAHVYLEVLNDNYEGPGNHVITTKRVETAFNEAGQFTYRRSNPVTEEWMVLGELTSEYESVKYDDKFRPAEVCNASEKRSQCSHMTYNEQGRITSLSTTGEDILPSTLTFEWKNDKMVHADYTLSSESNTKYERKFDEQGRAVEITLGTDYRTTITYSTIGSDEQMINRAYRNGKLNRTYIMRTNPTTKQFTYWCELNEKNDTLKEIKTVYDASHNLVSLVHTDHSRKYEDEPMKAYPEGSKPPVSEKRKRMPEVDVYTIENRYEDGLLVKRTIRINRNGYKRDDVPDMIERVMYEEEPLETMAWPADRD